MFPYNLVKGRSFFVLFLLASLALSGCSKSGGNNGLWLLLLGGGKTAPGISSVTPAADSAGISITTTVQVRFTKNMDAGSITNDTFTLADETGNPVMGTVSMNGRIATFTPVSPLGNLAQYTATLSTVVMDRKGIPLTAAFSWSFTTVSLGQVPALEFSIIPDTYDSAQTVGLSCDDTAADIYYTTNGDDPDTGSTHYEGTPVSVSQNMTIRAIAVRTGYDDSEIAAGEYHIRAAKPSFSPEVGEHDHDINVTLSATGGATIYYTTGSGDPDTLYTGSAIEIHGDGASATIRAWGVKDGLDNSAIVEASYSVNFSTAAAPSFDPTGATFNATQTVTLHTNTDGATIRYTTDGSDPKEEGNLNIHDVVHEGTVEVAENTTINAYAFKTGLKPSGTTTENYYVRVAAPESSETTGTHDHDLAIHLTAVTGATIYYTLGGGDPDIEYNDASPILITGDNAAETIRAKAVKTNMEESGVISFFYEVQYGTSETPVFEPDGDTYTTTQNVTITSTAGSTIRYTTDGSDPKRTGCDTCTDAPSPASVEVGNTVTIRAYAYMTMMLDSEEAQENYLIAPTLVSVIPAEGIGTGTVSVTLTGTNFKTGADVRLKMGTESDIVATDVIITSSTEITAILNINGMARGYWDVVVTNTDTSSATLADGFHVTPSTNAYLSGLSVSAGTMNPIFNKEAYTYNVLVADGIDSITVTPTAADLNATITVSSAVVASGAASLPFTYSNANNKITIVVTAEDTSTQQTYTLFVRRYARFAYIVNSNDNTISIYTVNATTGQLRHNGYTSAGSMPLSVTVDPSGRFVYTSNVSSNNISVYTIDQTTGALTAGTAVAAGTSPFSVTVDPSGRFAYAANQGGTVSVYTIDQVTGALTAGTAVTAGSDPSCVVVHPSGRFAYVANSMGDNVSVYSINQVTGALTAGTAVPTGSRPYSLTVDPSGKFAYVANFESSTISTYAIDQDTGALTAGTSAPTGANPRSVAVDPTGRFAYTANYGGNTVSVYTIDQDTGALTAGTAVATGNTPYCVNVDPSGKYVYAVNLFGNTVSAYTIDQATGALTLASTVSARSYPSSITFTSGTSAITYVPKFAYTANLMGGNVSVFAINQTSGVLTAGTAVTAGLNPFSVAADPLGKFLYAANLGSNTVSVYTIDQGSGALTAGTAASAGASPRGVTVDPNGKFLYCANAGGNNVSVFTINQTTGELSGGATVSAETGPWSIAVDPSGRFAYATNYSSYTVSVYTVDKTTGGLTAGTSVSTGTGSRPTGIAIDPSGRFVYTGNVGSNNKISVFTINQSTGALTGVSENFNIISYNVCVDPSGKYLFAPHNDGYILIYSINQTTGALTLASSAGADGAQTQSIAVDVSGKFVYAGNFGSSSISGYTVDQPTGALTKVTSGSSGTNPQWITTTGVIQ